jgi:hypothetical protein
LRNVDANATKLLLGSYLYPIHAHLYQQSFDEPTIKNKPPILKRKGGKKKKKRD